ncbi:MAG: hypothetical protein ACO239_07950 [Sediminibacterium sp.]
MIKVSHEVPKCLLKASLEFNDYQYCLPHLLDQDGVYKKHFYDFKKSGGYIIMDNSLHELGEAYDHERLMFWVNELEPDEFIVPDVWMDVDSTIQNAKEWIKIKYPSNTTPVAVVQSKSFKEAEQCYLALKNMGYKKIAMSYGADWYAEKFPGFKVDKAKMMGRIAAVKQMFYNGTIKKNDRVHLLGCSLPQEFGWYENCSYIESIDTSNPVMAALEGIKYSDTGLDFKPKANMNDYFNIDSTKVNLNLVLYNVKTFKKINEL